MARKNYSIDLIRQMAECDANYIRLLKLLPVLQAYKDRSFSMHASFHSDHSEQDDEFNSFSNDSGSEPEKVLEGIRSEYVISDLENSSDKVTVEISIQEAFKYTTTLELVQKPIFKKWMTNPSMLVRVYHDACTAEVVSYQGHRNLKPRYSRPNPKMYYADEKMQVNCFLGEWLSLCLKVGRSTKTPNLIFNS